jgi:2-oxoglutarate dehydrogenase E2 component (dihydrolipoamide succinyltransferase)
MARFEMVLPAMGEGIIEATITRWFVSKGQHVSIDQPLVEVATDKVDSEIPSPMEGTVVQLVYREGEIPKIGAVIALIDTASPGPERSDEQTTTNVTASAPISPNHKAALPRYNPGDAIYRAAGDSFISPLVRMLAKQRGLSPDTLRLIKGTGLDGRITKEDIRQFISADRAGRINLVQEPLSEKYFQEPDQPASEAIAGPDDKIVEMDRVRRLIAGNMIRSKRIAAQVTSFLEADITALVNWREMNKEKFLNREKAKLTFTLLFIEAVALALKEYPGINVTLSDDSIIFRKSINIGLATALPDGNLIVPVIMNADQENLGGLARIVADLANRARSNSLLPAEIKGGTFTITNIGQYNNLTGTPIINQPESAILAVGTIIKKPWAVNTSSGYGLAIRDITMLSLTYDHRVIDGALGGSFLSRIAWHLENFNVERE